MPALMNTSTIAKGVHRLLFFIFLWSLLLATQATAGGMHCTISTTITTPSAGTIITGNTFPLAVRWMRVEPI